MTDVAQTKAPEPSTNEPSNQALQLFTGSQYFMVTDKGSCCCRRTGIEQFASCTWGSDADRCIVYETQDRRSRDIKPAAFGSNRDHADRDDPPVDRSGN